MSNQRFTDWQPGVVFWRRVTAFAWFALVAVVLLATAAGCVQSTPTEPESTPIVVEPITDTTPDALTLNVAAEASLVATLHEVIGDAGSVTLNPAKSIVVARPEATLTIKPGTRLTYSMNAGRGRFEFSEPRPRVTAKIWGLRVSPELTRLDLNADNTGTAHVQSGPVKLQRTFALTWIDNGSGATETEPATRPVVTIYTTDGCGYCTAAKRDLAGAPFELRDVSTRSGGVPRWVQSFPTFHWQGRDGWRQFVGWPGKASFLEMWTRSTAEQYHGNAANAWTFPGSTRAELIAHLDDGEHAGKFDREQLAGMTFDELRALHADDHEGVVDWAVVRRQPRQASRPPPVNRAVVWR